MGVKSSSEERLASDLLAKLKQAGIPSHARGEGVHWHVDAESTFRSLRGRRSIMPDRERRQRDRLLLRAPEHCDLPRAVELIEQALAASQLEPFFGSGERG